MTEDMIVESTISIGKQPRGYTVWVNDPFKCRIRICGLTEEQAQSLRDGCLDITLGKIETPGEIEFTGQIADMNCPKCGSADFYKLIISDVFICKNCGYHEV